MARADLLCELIRAGLMKDDVSFRKAAEAICAEERSKQHEILANKITELLNNIQSKTDRGIKNTPQIITSNNIQNQLFSEKTPIKRLDQLMLPENVYQSCRALIEEQMRTDLLRSYGLEPRNKILLIGPPGNGKTSVAEGIAESLMIPLLTVKYDSII